MMNRSYSVIDILLASSRETLWAPVLVVFLHWLLAGYFGHEPYVDPIMHAAGGAAAAYFFLRLLEYGRLRLPGMSGLKVAVLAIVMAALVAATWEFGEYLLVIDRGTGAKWRETLVRDLLLGTGGAALFACLCSLMRFRR